MPQEPAATSPRTVPLLIAAGFALRLWVAMRAGIIEHDGAYYAGLAAALLRGDHAHGWSTVWPPLYPVLVAAAAWPFAAAHMLSPERLEIAARLVSVIAGTVVLALLHRWTRRMAGERAALVALAVAAFHPRLVQYSASALTEMTFIALLLAGLVLIAAGDTRTEDGSAAPESDRVRRSFAASSAGSDLAGGAAFGLACLARPEGAVLAAAVAMALAVRGLRAKRRNMRFAFALGVLVAVAPWAGFLSAELGHVSLGEKGAYNFWREFKPEYRAHFGDPPGLSERVFESPELAAAIPPVTVDVVGFVRAEPWLVITRSLGRLVRIVTQSMPQACYPVWFVIAILGIPSLVRPAWWPAAAMLVALPILYAPFSADRRFFVPAVPLLLALVPAGIERLATWVAPPARRAWLSGALAIALGLAGLVYTMIHPLMDDAPEHREAGRWLRAAWPGLAGDAASPSNPPAVSSSAPYARMPAARPVVMSRKTWVAFYSGGIIAELPEGGLDSVLSRARRKRADVLVVDERWAAPNRPELAPLLDPALAPPSLRVLKVIDTPRRLVLYDLRAAR